MLLQLDHQIHSCATAVLHLDASVGLLHSQSETSMCFLSFSHLAADRLAAKAKLEIDCDLARVIGSIDEYLKAIAQASGRSQLSTAAFH